MTVLFPLIVIGLLFGLAIVLKSINHEARRIAIALGIAYFLSLFCFLAGMYIHDNQYFTAIDPVDMECYSPVSDRHVMSLLVYFVGFNVSVALVWARFRTLAPLSITLCAVFLLIGIVLGAVILFQVSEHDLSTVNMYDDGSHKILFMFAPACAIVIATLLLYRIVKSGVEASHARKYSSKYLNLLNDFLADKSRNLFWISLFLLPVYLLVTLVLLLLGQDTDSIVKVFTDTATWKLSQRAHPPVLGHNGHYLCTVAAAGNPKIVKPLRFGTRHGKTIIVNRQLLVANAFEELLHDFSPRFHRFVRRNYDRYGLDLSRRINTEFMSNLTYVLMKPLEWFFVACLYLFCKHPERRINRQYGG